MLVDVAGVKREDFTAIPVQVNVVSFFFFISCHWKGSGTFGVEATVSSVVPKVSHFLCACWFISQIYSGKTASSNRKWRLWSSNWPNGEGSVIVHKRRTESKRYVLCSYYYF